MHSYLPLLEDGKTANSTLTPQIIKIQQISKHYDSRHHFHVKTQQNEEDYLKVVKFVS